MTKTLNQIIFFPPPKTEYFFRKKTITPPFKLTLIAANKRVLLLYACAHKILLKYLFPEKNAIEICC